MNKKKLLACWVLFLCFIGMLFGFIKINLINTRALSPLGNANENYKVISEEFGKDFSEFVKDNSDVKIYREENGEYLVKAFNEDYRVTTTSSFVENLKSIGEGILGTINDIVDWFEGLI
ncbi:MAG: hypothetical protein ACRC2K_11020 [Clostridium sp.]